MTQHTRTIVKAIRNGEVEALRERLRVRGDEVQHGLDTRFHDIPGLHFLSCCILEQIGKRCGWFLVVELSFDGDVRPFFEWLAVNKRDVVDELLSSCEGYPGTTADSSPIISYLLDRTAEQAVYVGAPGRGRQQIEEETGLRRRVAALLDRTAPLSMSRAERWQRVVDGIYAESPALRGVPKRPLRVRLNLADPVVRARFAAGVGLAVFAAAWIVGVAAPFFLADTWWRRALVAAPPVVLGVWAAWVFVRLSPRGLVTRMAPRIWGQGIREGVRTAMYVAPVGGLALVAGALDVARVSSAALVTAGALLAVVTVILIAALVFSIFGRVAAAAAVLVAGALLWRFPRDIVLAFSVTTLTIAVLLIAFAWWIRRREAKSVVQDEEDDLAHLRVVTRREYQQLQSHLAAETDIAGKFRMRILRSVLRWVNTLAFFLFNLGHLDKITSIHFARFIVLPERRTLLFFSNYDGRFEDYLGAFSTASGVTAVWGNAVGFPRPFLLLFDGARAENLFKRYGRASQVESLVWFSAYKNLSVAEIDRATYLRESLARPIDRRDTGVLAALRRVMRPMLDEQTLVYLMDGR